MNTAICPKLLVFLSIFAFITPASFAQITVYSSGSLAIGETKGLVASVSLTPNTITWTVNGIAGGNASVGKIVSTGVNSANYTAPALVPAANKIVIRATSKAFPSKYGEATLTVTQLVPQLLSINPTSTPPGPFTISLNGANFGANSVVKFGTVTLNSSLLSPTSMTATGTATNAEIGSQVAVSVTNTGNGAVTSQAVNLTVTPAISLQVTPATATVVGGGTQQFTATVSGSTNTTVKWTLTGAGTLSASGLYTAPASVVSAATATVTAVSAARASATASATITLKPNPVTITISPASAYVLTQGTKQFTATASDGGPVTWSISGGGSISATGLYTAPAAVPTPGTVSVQANSVASPASSALAAVRIVAAPSTVNLSAARFLEQAAFGPTPVDLAHLRNIGISAWLSEQMSMPETPIADVPTNENSIVQQQYMNRLSAAPDQLRQRMVHALTELIVISANKNIYADEIVPYLRIISHNAFGNYRTLLGQITVSSQMGNYLDLARSMKPAAGSGANENYARELMQLFTIGVNQLNPDGSLVLDNTGKPIPNYTQADVQQIARAFTGWVYANNAWLDFSAPMVPNDDNHDTSAKTFLNCSTPAGQTTTQDTNAVLDCVFNHPNMGPFLATRLIRALVTSNPTPAYIQRISSVFNDNGQGERGDLSAVVKAILTDAEARNDAAPSNAGRLKDAMYHIVALLRAFNGSFAPVNISTAWALSFCSQVPLDPPSVFSFYSPLYQVPKSPLFGPEFQIYGPTEAVERGNLFWYVLTVPSSDYTVDLSTINAVAADTPALIEAVDQALLYGRMPAAMFQSLATAIDAQQDNTSRVQTALQLTALSGLYAVQY